MTEEILNETATATAAEAPVETPVMPENEAATTADPDPSAIINALTAELQRVKQELEAEREGNLRLQADFTNFRRRKEKEVFETRDNATADMARVLLPLLDDLDRAVAVVEKTDNVAAIREGFEMVQKNFLRIFAKVGVEAMADSRGQQLDSNFHEVITTIPAPDPSQANTVFDVAEKGYLFREKVIRYAKVVVAE